jgi:hypothetical protein
MKFDRSPRYLVHLSPSVDVFLDSEFEGICRSSSMDKKGDYPVVFDVTIGQALSSTDTAHKSAVMYASKFASHAGEGVKQ